MLSDTRFSVDWSPIETAWGHAVLELSDQDGVLGLLEGTCKFWKSADQNRSLRSSHGVNRSRSPPPKSLLRSTPVEAQTGQSSQLALRDVGRPTHKAALYTQGCACCFLRAWTGPNGLGGMRNNWRGDVGFRFEPLVDLIVLALGRQCTSAGLSEAV